MTPDYWHAAQQHLNADATMAALMARFPSSILKTRGAPFETLVRAVVGQQISVKAADAVWGRLLATVGTMEPQPLLASPDDALRGAGLSAAKVRYVRGIAEAFRQEHIHPSRWPDMDDDAVLAELVRLPGIGRWTAEMFLIFNLQRPDVLPLDDLGLLKAFQQAYGPVRGTARLAHAPSRWRKVAKALAKHGESWRPYRTVATWYLWRSLDPVEVNY